MKVRSVNIGPSSPDRLTLTPEALAATGARYSRSAEGLEVLSEKTQTLGVDGIFKMVDYGHRSIADMAPIAIFMDGISMWLAYYIWSECPRASGQEVSTRYCNFGERRVVNFGLTNIPEHMRSEWNSFICDAFNSYDAITADLSEMVPDGLNQRQARNWVFDRARYHIPSAALTGVMMIQSARDWCELISKLMSHPILEASTLGAFLAQEVALITPRLAKHMAATDDRIEGWKLDDTLRYDRTKPGLMDYHVSFSSMADTPPVWLMEQRPCNPLGHHPHRYSWVGKTFSRVFVHYLIPNLAFADMRDLNRHRTGYKFTDMVPVGFYDGFTSDPDNDQSHFQAGLRDEHPSHVYWSQLGTEYMWEHGTTLDKVIYEIELRTGPGAHFRYREHMLNIYNAMRDHLPYLKGRVLIGEGEPE